MGIRDDSSKAIYDFRSCWGILAKNAQIFRAAVKVETDFGEIHCGLCRFSFSENIACEDMVINIEWEFSDCAMRSLGLHGSYNINFQTFSFDARNKALCIIDDTNELTVKISDVNYRS